MMRVMVFGTFDMIHEGHLDLFRQARALGESVHLIVSLARDENVQRMKGRLPVLDEDTRADALRKSGHADEVVLGDVVGFLSHIRDARPDVIALGYDQVGEYVDGLERALATEGDAIRIVRLQSYQPETFKTSKLRGN